MNTSDLIEHLKSGLRAVFDDVQNFSEDYDALVRPEYLKTVAMAQVLKKAIGSSGIIRLEQDTGQTLGASVLPNQRPANFSSAISRSGEIDIVLNVEENGWQYPVVVIENKLFSPGYSTISKDVERCVEFISIQGACGSIELAAVTYFRIETGGMTMTHQDNAGRRALDRIKQKSYDCAIRYSVFHQHDDFKLLSTAFDTEEAALAPDADGMPAYLSQPAYTIWGGIEIFSIKSLPFSLKKL